MTPSTSYDTIVAVATLLLAAVIFLAAWWADHEHSKLMEEFRKRDRIVLRRNTAANPPRKEATRAKK